MEKETRKKTIERDREPYSGMEVTGGLSFKRKTDKRRELK